METGIGFECNQLCYGKLYTFTSSFECILYLYSCRFFYERQGQFTPDQLVQLKQATLSRIICDNSDGIDRVPPDAFVLQDTVNFVSCSELPMVDLMLWKECGRLFISLETFHRRLKIPSQWLSPACISASVARSSAPLHSFRVVSLFAYSRCV